MTAEPSPRRLWVSYAALAMGVGAAVVLLGYLPAGRVAGAAGQQAFAVGCLVSVLASFAAAWPLARLSRAAAAGSASIRAIGQATALRFLVAVGGAVWAWSTGVFRPVPLVIGLGVSYLAVLGVETAFTLRRWRDVRGGPPRPTTLG